MDSDNNMFNNNLNKFSSNDSSEINDLLNISDTEIPMDLLAQLESKAIEEQKKMEEGETEIPVDLLNKHPEEQENNDQNTSVELPPMNAEDSIQQVDIDLQQGIPAMDGSVSISGEVTEHPKNQEKTEEIVAKVNKKSKDLLEEAKLNAVYKKYVVYINKENEQFIDSLSLQERKEIINQVLDYQKKYTAEQRRDRKRIERIIKGTIALITFLIAIPVFYYLFNVCIGATMHNYQQSKENFEVLYKQNGKIKPTE